MAKQLVREVELWIHSGTITKAATKSQTGRITANNGVVVVTDINNSFGAGSDLNEKDKQVFFFAVPLEYLIPESQLAGIGMVSPLLAVNIYGRRRSLVKKPKTLQKLTPCGTGSTIQPTPPSGTYPPLAMKPIVKASVFGAREKTYNVNYILSSGRKPRRAGAVVRRATSESKNQDKIYYVINDYGQLIMVRSSTEINPWYKIIASGNVRYGLSSSCNWRGTRSKPDAKDTERMRLCYTNCGEDPYWEWK